MYTIAHLGPIVPVQVQGSGRLGFETGSFAIPSMRVKGEALRCYGSRVHFKFQSRLCMGFRFGLGAVLGARLKGE